MSFRIEKAEPYVLGELAERVAQYRQRGIEVFDFSQINPALGPHPAALEVLLQQTLRPHNHRYSSSQGISKLRTTVSEWAGATFGLELNADSEIVVTQGSKEGIAHLLMAIASPGEAIIIPTPAYPVHRSAAYLAGLEVVEIPLCAEEFGSCVQLSAGSEQFFAELRRILRESTRRPRYLLCNFPHNPTGTVADESFFQELCKLALAEELVLIHDFAYWGISFDGYVPPSILSGPEAERCAIEFYSFSKSLSVPGWRIGAAAGNARLIAALKKIKSYTDYGVFQPVQIATIELLKRSAETLSEANSVYQSRRDIVVDELELLGFDVPEVRSGLCVWARLPLAYRSAGALEFCRMLLERSRVALCPGEGFDRCASEYIRVALIASDPQLRAGMAAVREGLDPKVNEITINA